MCAECDKNIEDSARKRLGKVIFFCDFCEQEVHPKDMDERPDGKIFCPQTYNELLKQMMPSNCRTSFEARAVRHFEAGGGL